MGLAIEDIGTPGIDKLTKAGSRSRVSSCSINKLIVEGGIEQPVAGLDGADYAGNARCAELLAKEAGHAAIEPTKLIAPMIARFLASDRAFVKAKRP